MIWQFPFSPWLRLSWSSVYQGTSYALAFPFCNFHSFFPIILSCSNDQKVGVMTGTLVQWTRKTMQNQIPKHNTLHWDRNSKFSLFLHNGNVFVFKINNRGGKLGQNFTAHLSRQVPGLEMHQKDKCFLKIACDLRFAARKKKLNV